MPFPIATAFREGYAIDFNAALRKFWTAARGRRIIAFMAIQPGKVESGDARERPKMSDVARLAGVSVATVSRVLSGSSLVNAETRDRVRHAVGSTGYVVHSAASGLRLQRSRQLLVILPTIANAFFAEIVLGVEEAAQAAGFGVLIGSTGDQPNRQEGLTRQLLTGAVDGLLLLTGQRPLGVPEAPQLRQRIVAISEHIPRSGIPAVSIDNVRAMAAVTRHLLQLGHRRIGFIGAAANNILTREREKGFRTALLEARVAFDPSLLIHADYSMEAGAKGLQHLLLQTHPALGPVTAVACCSDEIAIGVVRSARLAGLSVPGDLSVTGFDDIQFAAAYDPPLTTIRQPRLLMGRAAATLLLEALEGDSLRSRRLNLDYQLMVRGSTAVVSRTASRRNAAAFAAPGRKRV
ncbi:LacI family DNA-binding transcriptional regulator [Roseomonas elaeocarpi]|uniref:LacI family DNA-binding transcriptional regulator n=1 Tax=Roseomonas elaeocarpi TaxID=907779 RepID=A0ABV6JMG0_9PROT